MRLFNVVLPFLYVSLGLLSLLVASFFIFSFYLLSRVRRRDPFVCVCELFGGFWFGLGATCTDKRNIVLLIPRRDVIIYIVETNGIK